MAKNDEAKMGDEYTYSEETGTDAYPTRRTNPLSSVASKISKQRVIVAVIGIVIIFYVIMRIFAAIEHRHKVSNEIVPASSPAKETKAQPTNPTLVAQHTDITHHPLYQSTVNHQQQLQNMTSEVDNINSKLYNIQESIRRIDDQMAKLQYIVMQQARMAAEKQAIAQAKVQQRAHHLYQVYAVIPNRAWLYGPQGATITVRVGSYLPQVGIVVAIDPVSGTVFTNSGAKISFALTDQ
ncbi:MAG: hypothetical protein KIT27_11990 [Legionellales bacterium]|nr:hypothetical protein [Legionellales bacterium]